MEKLSPLLRISTLFVGDQQPFSFRTNASQGNDGSYGLVVRSGKAGAAPFRLCWGPPNVPRALGVARKKGWSFDIMTTSFFLSRRSVRPDNRSGR